MAKFKKQKVQVVILCGGKGTRLKEQTETIPKPMVEIGGMPILWHIMKCYAHYGFKDFILCLGYKGEKIKDFFLNFHYWNRSDFIYSQGTLKPFTKQNENEVNNWRIIFAETGAETNTGGRRYRVQKYIQSNPFFVTYGDGLSNINFHHILSYHKKHGKIATLTCVRPHSQFGIVEIGKNQSITKYLEKPRMSQWVNGGFFVFDKKVFSYIKENDILEIDSFNRLQAKGELIAYPFEGFWACMDTYKDAQNLNELWNRGKASWKVWK